MARELPFKNLGDLQEQEKIAKNVNALCEATPDNFDPILHLPFAKDIVSRLDPLLEPSLVVNREYNVGDYSVTKRPSFLTSNTKLIFIKTKDSDPETQLSRLRVKYDHEKNPIKIDRVHYVLTQTASPFMPYSYTGYVPRSETIWRGKPKKTGK